jgi:hypothetical protein
MPIRRRCPCRPAHGVPRAVAAWRRIFHPLAATSSHRRALGRPASCNGREPPTAANSPFARATTGNREAHGNAAVITSLRVLASRRQRGPPRRQARRRPRHRLGADPNAPHGPNGAFLLEAMASCISRSIPTTGSRPPGRLAIGRGALGLPRPPADGRASLAWLVAKGNRRLCYRGVVRKRRVAEDPRPGAQPASTGPRGPRLRRQLAALERVEGPRGGQRGNGTFDAERHPARPALTLFMPALRSVTSPRTHRKRYDQPARDGRGLCSSLTSPGRAG